MVTKESEKFISSTILEGMTSISALLNSSENNDRKIIKVLYNESKIKKHFREFNYLKKMSLLHGFEIETVSEDIIEQNTIGNTFQLKSPAATVPFAPVVVNVPPIKLN